MVVNSFSEYWEQIVPRISKDQSEILFLRGQANGEYQKILPGTARPQNLLDESEEYKGIQIDYPDEFRRNEHLSNLVKMQHYGCTTRLLDFSMNPLVALFFASEDEFKKNGKVFVISVPKEKILYQYSDKATMLACLPVFSKKDRDDIRDFCIKHPDKITDQDIQDSNVMRRFLHEIRNENPAFVTEIIGNDLLQYYFIRPYKDNERMKTQAGAFAIFGLNEEKLVDDINQETEIIEISASAKPQILRELEVMQINISTVYPGLERRAMIQRNKTARWQAQY